jgi:hypothetical protein
MLLARENIYRGLVWLLEMFRQTLSQQLPRPQLITFDRNAFFKTSKHKKVVSTAEKSLFTQCQEFGKTKT